MWFPCSPSSSSSSPSSMSWCVFVCLCSFLLLRCGEVGAFVALHDVVLTAEEAPPILARRSHCACRNECRSNAECRAYSATPIFDTFLCQFFVNGPIKYTVKTATGKKLYAKEAPPGTLEGDGLYYFVPNGGTPAPSWDEAKVRCQTYPGFRLALIKTMKSRDVAFKYYAATSGSPFMTIDMIKTGPNTTMIGDTNVYDTELIENNVLVINDLFSTHTIFVLARENFHDERRYQRLVPLCQGNFLNIDY